MQNEIYQLANPVLKHLFEVTKQIYVAALFSNVFLTFCGNGFLKVRQLGTQNSSIQIIYQEGRMI